MCIGFYGRSVGNLSPGTFTFITLSCALPQLFTKLRIYFIFLPYVFLHEMLCISEARQNTLLGVLLLGFKISIH